MKRRAVIGVGIAAQPIAAAGNMWFFLNWALSFRAAGWDVWIVESIHGDRCVDAAWQPCPYEHSANRAAWDSVIGAFGFHGRATLMVDGRAEDLEPFRIFAREAEVFLNLSGHFRGVEEWFPNACRVYLDADPAFTQIWAEAYHCDMNFAGHHRFFSVGRRLGAEGSLAPTCGIEWLPTWPPVSLEHWPFVAQAEFRKFTTVAHWHGYPGVEWSGRWFTGKKEQFDHIVSLPTRIGSVLEVATDEAAHEWELGPFREAGWRFSNAPQICGRLTDYEHYVRDASSAEFSAAKGGYVVSRTGWFSDRSVCYAASGRPLVLEDTGLREELPEDCGVWFFASVDEAAEACERVHGDFACQQRRVRAVAEEFFDGKLVVESMMTRIGL